MKIKIKARLAYFFKGAFVKCKLIVAIESLWLYSAFRISYHFYSEKDRNRDLTVLQIRTFQRGVKSCCYKLIGRVLHQFTRLSSLVSIKSVDINKHNIIL